MLKRIPKNISPDLMKIMMEMGHSDILIIADANYPAAANAKRLIRLDGVEIPDLLESILDFYPLDCFIETPVKLMKQLDNETVPEIWSTYRKIIIEKDDQKAFKDFGYINRIPFYEVSQRAYAIVQTGTTARYANILLQKGVI